MSYSFLQSWLCCQYCNSESWRVIALASWARGQLLSTSKGLSSNQGKIIDWNDLMETLGDQTAGRFAWITLHWSPNQSLPANVIEIFDHFFQVWINTWPSWTRSSTPSRWPRLSRGRWSRWSGLSAWPRLWAPPSKWWLRPASLHGKDPFWIPLVNWARLGITAVLWCRQRQNADGSF